MRAATTGPVTEVEAVGVQRRTVGVLSGAVALAGLGVTVGITLGGLLAQHPFTPFNNNNLQNV